MKDNKSNNNDRMDEEIIYCPIARAAARVGISEWALRQKIRKGLIPIVQSGDSTRVNIRVLRQVLQNESLENMRRQFEAAKANGMVTSDDEKAYNETVRMMTGGPDDSGTAI